ncbi:hypothetical protein BHM03_00062187 [Ensete ventricosum]|nr:hypothetical protein BHM03_00062187 [Ensete ventricosum]
MRLGTCQECVGSLLGWRKGVRQKKIETHWKIIGGSRKACRERCSGISSKFTRRFAEGIGKLIGNTPGDCRKKTRKLTARMPEAAKLDRKIPMGKPPMSDGCTPAAQVFKRLTVADPPKLGS